MSTPPPTDPPGGLRLAAARGARWTTASSVVSIAAQLIQLAILARLLSPREFGLATAVVVVLGLSEMIADAGISNAIVAKQTTDRGVLSSLYWANVGLGLGLSVAIVAAAPAITAWFGEEDLLELVLLGAPAPFLASFGLQFSAVLQKDLRFEAIAKVEMTAAVAGLAMAAGLAAAGAGAAALVAAYLTRIGVRALLLAARGWASAAPRIRLRRADLRGYLSFGLFQIGERVANYAGTNADYVLIGGVLGPSALGAYSVAWNLITVPQLRLNPIVTRIAFPIFARRSDDNVALRGGFVELTRLVAFSAFPLLAGMAVAAPVLVPVAFGGQWEESVPLVQTLSVVGVVFALGNVNGALFLAKGRPDIGFKLNLARLVLLAAAFAVALTTFGTVGSVATAYAVVVVVLFVSTRFLLWRLIGLSPPAYLRTLAEPAAATAVMAVAVLAAGWAAGSGLGGPDGAVLATQIAVGAAAYVLAVGAIARDEVVQLWRLVVNRAPRARPEAGAP